MANEQNLIPGAHKLTVEEQSRGGVASGKARRELSDFRKKARALMKMEADPSVARHMAKTGVPVEDYGDVALAGIAKGILRGDPRSVAMLLEYAGENQKENRKEELFEIERRKAEAEAERAEMETELMRMRLNVIKGIS